MEPASLTTWLQPLQLRTQSIQSVWKCQVLFRILQTFKNLNLLFIGQMIKSQSEECLAQNESNISVGVHVGSSLIKVKDTHLMDNNQPVADILCWRLHETGKATSARIAALGWGLLSQFSPFRYFPIFSEWSKQWLPVWYQVNIWQVSPQLSCGDTWQIWTWLKLSDLYFCQIKISRNGEINERSFSNPHPRVAMLAHLPLLCPTKPRRHEASGYQQI